MVLEIIQELKDAKIEILFKQRRCFCGIAHVIILLYYKYKKRVSFHLGFILRFVAIVNSFELEHYFILPCGRENTCIFSSLFLIRKVSRYERLCLLAMKPLEFVYSLLQQLKPRLKLPASLTDYEEYSSLAQFIGDINAITARWPQKFDQFKRRLIQGKTTIAAAYKVGLKKAAVHYNVSINSDKLGYLNVLHFVRGLCMPNCEHGRQRSICKDCGGGSICEHRRYRSRCKDCGGGSICEHGNLKRNCDTCICKRLGIVPSATPTQAPSRKENYCEVCQEGFDYPSQLQRHLITNKHRKRA